MNMETKKLARHSHYYHTHLDFFNNPQDLVHAFLMADYEIGMHQQEFYEINLVTSGSGVHYIEDGFVEAKVGDVFIIPPKISHGYEGGRNFDVFHVIISDSFMTKYIADLQQLPSFHTLFGAEPLIRGKTSHPLHLTLSKEAFEDTLLVMKKIAYYRDFRDASECLIRSNLAIVAIGLFCKAYSTEFHNDSTPSEDRALMESISYIHERYFDKITIQDLTKIAHISRSSYIRKFKEICKMPPSSYLTKIRVESAAMMLVNTTLSVSEIASHTGFYDASHFTKIFESRYSLSPIAYRNKFSV